MWTYVQDTNLETSIFNALIQSKYVHQRYTRKIPTFAKVGQKTALLLWTRQISYYFTYYIMYLGHSALILPIIAWTVTLRSLSL